MIKFFGKIRQKMLTENKFSKYLLYAIGEIILVVIGILIALQINTWNENRKDAIKEQQILNQLKEDYSINLLQLEQKIEHRNKIINAGNKILHYIDAPETIASDSLIAQLSIFIGSPTFKPIQNNLINSGDILLIKNKQLNRLLTSWPSDVILIQGIENIWSSTMVWETVIPLFTDIGIMREEAYTWWNDEQNLKWILEEKSDSPFQKPIIKSTLKTREILEDKRVEGIATMAVSVNHASNLQSRTIHKRIREILDLINQEIIKK